MPARGRVEESGAPVTAAMLREGALPWRLWGAAVHWARNWSLADLESVFTIMLWDNTRRKTRLRKVGVLL